MEIFYKTKLTRKHLAPRLKQKRIMRDPAFIQEVARKFMFKASKAAEKYQGYQKASIQVCHEDLHQLCSGESCCRKSKWMKPLFHIGKERSEIAIAGPTKPTSKKENPYFIESIEAFHRFHHK